jgi:uncharacterized protein
MQISSRQSGARLAHMDSLRGIAIFGILFVNIWSFVWGASPLRYGVLAADAGWTDQAAVLLCSFLAEQKSYPILAFLFGAGFTLQMQTLLRRYGDRAAARAVLRRRPTWLVRCGALHGCLIWFGDILTLYGFAGFVLLRYDGVRLRELRASLLRWSIGYLLVMLVLSLGAWTISHNLDKVHGEVAKTQQAKVLNTQGEALDFAFKRLRDYGRNVVASVFALPNVMVLFLLGALSVRIGWLTRPQRHERFWRRVRLVGLGLGVPLNFMWGWISLREALDPVRGSATAEMLEALQGLAGPCMSAGIVACVVLASPAARARLAYACAPVGQMALTNYLMQSVLCMLILQTVGLGLGASISPIGLLGTAAMIACGQLAFSRWWLAHFPRGPVETLYRRYADGV